MANEVTIRITADAKGLDKGVGQAQKKLDKLEKKTSSLAGLLGKTFAVGAVAMAGAKLVGLAGTTQQTTESFMRLSRSAESTGDEMVAAMQKASAGTISENNLMLNANRAMMLGVADSAEEFSRLMVIARDRGRAMGLSTEQAFNDIVTGIGRQSAMILDNLGLVMNVGSANEQYAAKLGKTVEQLSDAEKKQAFLNAALEQGEKNLDTQSLKTETLNEKLAILKTRAADTAAAFSEKLLPALITIADKTIDLIDSLPDLWRQWKVNNFLMTETAANTEVAMNMWEDYSAAVLGVRAAQEDMGLDSTTAQIANQQDAIGELTQKLIDMRDVVHGADDDTRRQQLQEIEDQIYKNIHANDELERLQARAVEAQSLQAIEARNQVEAAQTLNHEFTMVATSAENTATQWDKFGHGLDEIIEKAREAGKALEPSDADKFYNEARAKEIRTNQLEEKLYNSDRAKNLRELRERNNKDHNERVQRIEAERIAEEKRIADEKKAQLRYKKAAKEAEKELRLEAEKREEVERDHERQARDYLRARNESNRLYANHLAKTAREKEAADRKEERRLQKIIDLEEQRIETLQRRISMANATNIMGGPGAMAASMQQLDDGFKRLTEVFKFHRDLGARVGDTPVQEAFQSAVIGLAAHGVSGGAAVQQVIGEFARRVGIEGFQTAPGQSRVVPGSPGEGRLAVVHGGETIGRGGGAGMSFHFHGDVFGVDDLETHISTVARRVMAQGR